MGVRLEPFPPLASKRVVNASLCSPGLVQGRTPEGGLGAPRAHSPAEDSDTNQKDACVDPVTAWKMEAGGAGPGWRHAVEGC